LFVVRTGSPWTSSMSAPVSSAQASSPRGSARPEGRAAGAGRRFGACAPDVTSAAARPRQSRRAVFHVAQLGGPAFGPKAHLTVMLPWVAVATGRLVVPRVKVSVPLFPGPGTTVTVNGTPRRAGLPSPRSIRLVPVNLATPFWTDPETALPSTAITRGAATVPPRSAL